MASSNPLNSGAFIPSSFMFDISQIYSTGSDTPEFKELIVKLYQYLNAIALSVNIRDAGYYVTDEFVNGQNYFINPTLNSNSSTTPVFRQVYRKVINFGALPNAATKSVAHNILVNAAYTFTRIYGCASDPVALNYLPLPYSSSIALANNIELYVDATNVNIRTGANYSAYTTTYIILEYIKS